ncbi:hypothetical protein [Glycomyces sp. NRRL B-16210]|uniref:hypothetical protein n=1 Tax=Glycomyces sp. NRRL B-16210 TaxID=1463821 RepID=UPI000B1CD471|nr:hypothetical protein [Glycomyces sp. NRRL B-16210]
MVTVEIRDVPIEVHDALVAEAERRSQSLQDYLLSLFVEAARRRQEIAKRNRSGEADGG